MTRQTTLLPFLTMLLAACGDGGGNSEPSAAPDEGVPADAALTDDAAPTPDAAPPEPDAVIPPTPDASALADAAPDVAPLPNANASPDAGPPPPEVSWGDCPNYIALAPGFECAFAPLPLDRAQPDGRAIDVFFYRLPARRNMGKKQIWFLQGGPGGSGADFAQLFPIYAARHPEWEMYALDHRGVGNSARLSCSQEQSWEGIDWAGCAGELQAEWGDGLASFTTSEAANDVADLIEMTRQPGVPVFVYGVSYGTYWGLRYMRLHPEQADGVILDSICSPGHCRLDEYDRNFNETGRLLMETCAADATCAAKLGPDPWAFVGHVFEAADAGTLCGGAYPWLDRATLRLLLGMAVMDQAFRQMVPGLVYRLSRCDDRDRAVLDYFFEVLSGGHGGGFATPLRRYEDLDASFTLGTHIINTELLGEMTGAEVQAIADGAYFSTDSSPEMVRVLESGLWPRYPDDGHHNRFGETARPVLMLNGSLDPQTTMAMAQPSGDFYQGPNQTFVEVPFSPHGTIYASFTAESLDSYMSGSEDYLTRVCGFRIMESFIRDPEAAPDTSCLADLVPVEFSADSMLNQGMSWSVFGTDDMYEGELVKAGLRHEMPPRLNPARFQPPSKALR